jgi:hypothetical protein
VKIAVKRVFLKELFPDKNRGKETRNQSFSIMERTWRIGSPEYPHGAARLLFSESHKCYDFLDESGLYPEHFLSSFFLLAFASR